MTELALGAFARIKQDAMRIPAQQIPVVVAVPRRCLTCRAEDLEFSDRHVACLADGLADGPADGPADGVAVQAGLSTSSA